MDNEYERPERSVAAMRRTVSVWVTMQPVAVNGSGNQLSKVQQRAALLVAEDALTDVQIAEKCGIGERTLERWKHLKAFADAVSGHRDRWRAQIEAEGVANRQNRVNALNDRWNRMRAVIEARAEDMDGEIAGGGTGLLVRTEKQIGAGDRAQHIVEYAVDTGLLKELREHEKQAAQELGQWTDKNEQSGQVVIRVVYDDNADRS